MPQDVWGNKVSDKDRKLYKSAKSKALKSRGQKDPNSGFYDPEQNMTKAEKRVWRRISTVENRIRRDWEKGVKVKSSDEKIALDSIKRQEKNDRQRKLEAEWLEGSDPVAPPQEPPTAQDAPTPMGEPPQTPPVQSEEELQRLREGDRLAEFEGLSLDMPEGGGGVQEGEFDADFEKKFNQLNREKQEEMLRYLEENPPPTQASPGQQLDNPLLHRLRKRSQEKEAAEEIRREERKENVLGEGPRGRDGTPYDPLSEAEIPPSPHEDAAKKEAFRRFQEKGFDNPLLERLREEDPRFAEKKYGAEAPHARPGELPPVRNQNIGSEQSFRNIYASGKLNDHDMELMELWRTNRTNLGGSTNDPTAEEVERVLSKLISGQPNPFRNKLEIEFKKKVAKSRGEDYQPTREEEQDASFSDHLGIDTMDRGLFYGPDLSFHGGFFRDGPSTHETRLEEDKEAWGKLTDLGGKDSPWLGDWRDPGQKFGQTRKKSFLEDPDSPLTGPDGTSKRYDEFLKTPDGQRWLETPEGIKFSEAKAAAFKSGEDLGKALAGGPSDEEMAGVETLEEATGEWKKNAPKPINKETVLGAGDPRQKTFSAEDLAREGGHEPGTPSPTRDPNQQLSTFSFSGIDVKQLSEDLLNWDQEGHPLNPSQARDLYLSGKEHFWSDTGTGNMVRGTLIDMMPREMQQNAIEMG